MSTTWINRGHMFAPHKQPVMVDCHFQVDSTNALGITSLKGQGVSNVFMHTSTTPGRGSNGYLNPNPAAGNIAVQLSDNFSQLYQMMHAMKGPVTGSNIVITAGLTVGVVYQITVLGTSTAADWLAVGVPPGITPALGVSFIAISTGAGAGTGAVKALVSSGIDHIEIAGDPTLMLGPIPVGGSPNVGGWINLSCYLNSTLTAPTDGGIIRLMFYLSQSTVQVAGE